MPPRVPPKRSLRYVFGDPYAPAFLPPDKARKPRPPKAKKLHRSPSSEVVRAYRKETRKSAKESICEYLSGIRGNYYHEGVVSDDLAFFSGDLNRTSLPPKLARFIVGKQCVNDEWHASMKEAELDRWHMVLVPPNRARGQKYENPRASLLRNPPLNAEECYFEDECGFISPLLRSHSDSEPVYSNLTDDGLIKAAEHSNLPTRTISFVRGIPISERIPTIFVDAVKSPIRQRLRALSCTGSSKNIMLS